MKHARRSPWPARAGALVGVVAMTFVATGALPATAEAPVKYGWWSAANQGPVAPPAPPDVPAKGLYVENGFAGPTAVSALSFTLAPGETAKTVTLAVTGNPAISSAPVACPLKADTYQPAENGAWSDAPAYDCAHQLTGKVAADQSTVTFDVSGLGRTGDLAIAVLAGGPADRVAFEAPSASTLTVDAAPAASGTGTGTAGGGTGAYGGTGTYGGGSASSGTPPAPPAAPDQSVPAPQGDASFSPPAGTAAPAPAIAGDSGGAQQAPAPAGAPATRPVAAGAAGGSTGHRAASLLGLAALVVALVAWSEGFGVLGGRAVSLAVRRRTAATADGPEDA